MITKSFVALILATVCISTVWGQSPYTVNFSNKGGIGKYLVDSQGMTLYNSKRDSPGKSTCMGACAVMWPPFFAQTIVLPTGLQESDFQTITRDDGRKQTTYKGIPLYYFTDDKNPGDTNGDNVHHIWFAATPSVGSWHHP